MNGIHVEVRSVYGKPMIYPEAGELGEGARLLAELAGKKSLSASDLVLAEELGFGVSVSGAESDLKKIRREREFVKAARRDARRIAAGAA